jgi:hypothetical protein
MEVQRNLLKPGRYLLTIGLILLGLSACNGKSSQIISAAAKNSSSCESELAWQQQVNELNEKIKILLRWQQGYRMTAQQAQFKADRVQFQEENLVDAKRLWKIADNATQKAQDLQLIIDKLIEERNDILKKHNQPIPKRKGYETPSSVEEQVT